MPFGFGKKKDPSSSPKPKAEETPPAAAVGAPVGASPAKPTEAERDNKAAAGTASAPAPQNGIGPPPKDLEFPVQLAHGSGTKKVKGFTTVKQLYGRIAAAFDIEQKDLFFCTLGTDRVETDKLLGGQIGLNDVIFVHVRGEEKRIKVVKSEAALGLTITDNGAGCAFIKRIKEGSLSTKIPDINMGDHISSVNGRELFGVRHIEVARTLKELPVGEEFEIVLFSPKKTPLSGIAPRSTKGTLSADQGQVGTGRQTLRLKSSGQATVQTVDESSWTIKAAEAVDDCLESFMGIRDNELAETTVDAAKDASSFEEFKGKIGVDLEVFEFPDSFIEELWTCIKAIKDAPREN